jgi:hypothetical protein
LVVLQNHIVMEGVLEKKNQAVNTKKRK